MRPHGDLILLRASASLRELNVARILVISDASIAIDTYRILSIRESLAWLMPADRCHFHPRGHSTMHRATLIIGVLLSLTATNECIAEWGWPPPGYSVTGVRACDGYRYRGLCQVWRDRRSGRCQGCNSGQLIQPPVINGNQPDRQPSEPAPETLPAPRR